MKVLVCGGRNYEDKNYLHNILNDFHERYHIDNIIQGGAQGADTFARLWAYDNNILTRTYLPFWTQYGRAAGPKRNTLMLVEGQPDLVIAFPGGKGTADMMKQTLAHKIRLMQMFE